MTQRCYKIEIYKRIGGNGLYAVEVNGSIIGDTQTKWGARRLARKYVQNNCSERLYVDRYTIRGDIEA